MSLHLSAGDSGHVLLFAAAVAVFTLLVATRVAKTRDKQPNHRGSQTGTTPLVIYESVQPLSRYIRVSTESPPLVIGQVEVFVGETNVAPINGRPYQSSTQDDNHKRHGPHLAINGDLSATAFGHGDASRTKQHDEHPWWEVDLGTEMPIDQVNLWLQDRGRFPNPNPIWYLDNDVKIHVQLLCSQKYVKWDKWIHNWQDVITIPIK